jgi:nucleoid DNA-binding protein
MSTRTDRPPAAASSITVADWRVESAERGRGEKGAARDASLIGLVLKEITDALGRGDTVRLSWSKFESKAWELAEKRKQPVDADPNTGKPDRISHREMVFRPGPRAGNEMAEPAQHSIRRNSADLLPETDNYDVVQSDGAVAHVVVVPKDDPLGSTVSRVVERVPEIARIRRQQLTEKNIDALVELYLADDPVADARRVIETDNARERARFLSDVACLTSKEIARNAGHQAANASVTASRWKQQGRIFSVPSRGSELYPAFQFREGQPHPAVAKILRELPKQTSPWQIAFWFTSSNGWLRGATPADRLDDEAEVVRAAHRASEPIVG